MNTTVSFLEDRPEYLRQLAVFWRGLAEYYDRVRDPIAADQCRKNWCSVDIQRSIELGQVSQ